jgi:hypothetical protein
MELRGISESEIRRVLSACQPFPYNQDGVPHYGYYDLESRIFVAVVEDLVVTVFIARPTYIEALRRRSL